MTLNSFRFTFSITFIAFVSPKTFNKMVYYCYALPSFHTFKLKTTRAAVIFIYLTTRL